MKIESKTEILEILKMPYDEFVNSVKKEAKKVHAENNGDYISITALLGYDNICKN
jgi:hypothetical protein